ncbi:MAG: hypothetical protein SFX73_29975 [Kofleriaceae bacterium]|nr:hypothetical protein [Kofleriaceae bacterium]
MEVPVEVPAGMEAPPFDQPRTLIVPPGFGIRVIARVPTARFLAETPEGDVLVSKPGALAEKNGQIFRITNPGATAPEVSELASGLTLSHDMVFATVAGTTYLYVSETDRISRTPWTGNTLGTLEPVVDDLPSASLPELMGNYGHALKNIAIGGDRLYVSIASATNASTSDILANPVRGAVYAYDLDGANGRLFAKGIRNAEGLAIHPATGDLWVAVNHRDNVRYPLRDGLYPYGEVVQAYVNISPPEPFHRVRDGGNYGWPYCNPTDRDGNDDMPYLRDIDNNEDGSALDCDAIDRIDKGLPAHSAPLGMSFWTGDRAPSAYRNGAVIGLHGCWNCDIPQGYRVAFLAPRADNGFEDDIDLVTGFIAGLADFHQAWGRPVDAIPARTGNLYISDDRAGAVYELYRK